MNKKYFLIEEELLTDLLESYCMLTALECGGVDNWEWYGASIKDYCKENNIKNIKEAGEQLKDSILGTILKEVE